jgi:nitrate/nitrite transport system substrate-binding protein
VALITVPPPLMVGNLRNGGMHGFCVGEPWNARALADGLGFTAITSQEIWPDHPEKVCVFTESFAMRHPRTLVAALKALYLAGQWLDDPAHFDQASELLARPEYLHCDPSWIRSRLGDTIDYGDGRQRTFLHPINFAQRQANRPLESHAVWFLTQLRRWGLVYGAPDYAGLAGRIIRPEYCDQALQELGVSRSDAPAEKATFFDGMIFDAEHPEAYAHAFDIKHLQG